MALESLPFVAECPRCGFTEPSASEGDAVAAVLAHRCAPSQPGAGGSNGGYNRHRPRFTAEQRAEIVARHVGGDTVAQLAERFECSPAAIRYHLKAADEASVRPAPASAETVEVVEVGACASCRRPMQAKNGAPRQERLVFHGGHGQCDGCAQRRRRGLDGPATARGVVSGAARIRPPEELAEGLCAQTDPEAFFPEKGESTRSAKAICNGDGTREPCPVREACLQWALANNERHGIWGGLSERERRALRNAGAA